LVLPECVFIDDAPVERVEDGGGDERFYIYIELEIEGSPWREGVVSLVSSSFPRKSEEEEKEIREQEIEGLPSNNHPPRLTPLTFSLPYGNPVFTPWRASRVWFQCEFEVGAAETWCDWVVMDRRDARRGMERSDVNMVSGGHEYEVR
jgi:hypothetical protein